MQIRISKWMFPMLILGMLTTNSFLSAAEPTANEVSARELAFSQLLNNSVLVGQFSIDGQKSTDPHEERYEIESVKKYQGDLWTFTARIKYGKHDLKIPMTLKVIWAGDTPMISMTDVSVPPLGTFTARVFFHDSRYAGTWQHGDVGGHMWGRIETAKAPAVDSN
ncbi:hypothetical protein Pla110_21800 [Polystyrenella longa]|uniref:Uncharacterized protein n=1 Tax=Polystyrenella longa TaxID=2528007 RepID=A0A518CMJ7_9PLAN|nr:hypothetical protein [Polystyrenella longa]QDU80450.1 hypothetical protein Pla110_21800 [Polystyrenella longa]